MPYGVNNCAGVYGKGHFISDEFEYSRTRSTLHNDLFRYSYSPHVLKVW
jgi:hypothetical protein